MHFQNAYKNYIFFSEKKIIEKIFVPTLANNFRPVTETHLLFYLALFKGNNLRHSIDVVNT